MYKKQQRFVQLNDKDPTVLCDYCKIEESVEHVMLYCNKYVRQQEKLKKEIAKHEVEELSLEIVFTSGIGSMCHYLRETGFNKII